MKPKLILDPDPILVRNLILKHTYLHNIMWPVNLATFQGAQYFLCMGGNRDKNAIGTFWHSS